MALRLPSGAERVHFDGATILPGLIDCRVHLSDAGLPDATIQDRDPPALRSFRVAAHAHGIEGIRRAVEAGVDTIEHGTHLGLLLYIAWVYAIRAGLVKAEAGPEVSRAI
ncbi:MAG TPA: hypothetical protein VK197_03090 [Verrucomicrobiae bacterium]|nr:hypothetical protein [Verrucomicrobiae bacterium]